MKIETRINRILNSDLSLRLKILKLYGVGFSLIPGSYNHSYILALISVLEAEEQANKESK